MRRQVLLLTLACVCTVALLLSGCEGAAILEPVCVDTVEVMVYGTWVDGIFDPDIQCWEKLDANATDYTGCCPDGATPIGWATEDTITCAFLSY